MGVRMLKKSLISLIGIFTMVLVLSSCNTTVRTISAPVDDNNKTAAGGGGGDIIEEQTAPLILQQPANFELCALEGEQQFSEFEIIAVGADSIRWTVIIEDVEYGVEEVMGLNLISNNEKLSFTAEGSYPTEVTFLVEVCNNFGCVKSEPALLTISFCDEENTDYTKYFSFAGVEDGEGEVQNLTFELTEEQYPIADECAPNITNTSPSSSFVKLGFFRV